eukprot:125029-Alexandrium_andersonii.AAC.1
MGCSGAAAANDDGTAGAAEMPVASRPPWVERVPPGLVPAASPGRAGWSLPTPRGRITAAGLRGVPGRRYDRGKKPWAD